MLRKAVIFAIVFLIFFFLMGIGRQVYNALGSAKRMDAAADNFAALQKKNQELKKQLAQSQSSTFIEEQARDKLNMARDGETVVIIAPEEVERIMRLYNPPQEPQIPNWQRWYNLIFH
jgi:cell division protein FtsB